MKLNVKTTLNIHMILVILLIALPIILLNWTIQKSSDALNSNNAIYSDLLLELSTIDSALRNTRFHAYAGFMHDTNLSVAHYHAHPFELHLDIVKANLQDADSSWTKILSSNQNKGPYAHEISNLKQQYDAYMQAASVPVVKALEQHDWDSIVRLITAAIPEYAEFSDSIHRLQKKVDADAKAGYTQSQNELTAISQNLMLFYSIAIALYIAFSFWFSRRLLTPLNDNIRIAEKIANGDLTTNKVPARDDEFGLFYNAMEQMRQQLSTMISRIIAESTTVSSYSSGLKQTSKTAEESITSQMSRLTGAASALEELLVSIEDISRHSENTNNKATEAEQAAILNSQRVSDTEAGIQDVSHNLLNTSSQVQELSGQVTEISSITGVIQDVAAQTNLLALNAAIEAARAGEQGRGFAVVADEVRSLAETTTQSVDKISTMITAIQENAQATVASMQTSCEKTESVVSTTSVTKQSIDSINEITSTVQALVADISRALSEQKTASNDLSSNVEYIASLAQENTDLMVNISNTADQLSDISLQLKTSVAGFKLDS
ncbi:MAG: methyl-accepting chemotaxis protein [Amphritea sp.]|nr:methyl-accepting chemotaxis protein [Amphritea sp.]